MMTANVLSQEYRPSRPLQAEVDEIVAAGWSPDSAAVPDITKLQSCLQEIYASLTHHPGFFGMVSMARRFVPVPGVPTFSTTIAEGPDYKLSLMGVHRLRPVPMHDHPAGAGVQLMLVGRARVRHFDLAQEHGLDGGMARVEWNVDGEYRCGELTGYLPCCGNIHDISAVNTTAVLLSLQLPRCVSERQSWYFPLELLDDGEPGMLCRRIRKRRVESDKATRPAILNGSTPLSEIRI